MLANYLRHLAVMGLILLGLLPAVTGEAAGHTVKQVLPNGLTVIVRHSDAADIAAITVLVGAGSARDGDLPGIANLTGRMLLRGTTTRPGSAVVRELEDAGGFMNVDVTPEFTVLEALTPARDYRLGLKLMADCLFHPAFDGTEMEREREVVVREISALKDDPKRTVALLFQQNLYGQHPYARPVPGEPATVAALTREQVMAFHRQYYTPQNTVIAVVGNVKPAEVAGEIAKLLGMWPARPVLPLKTAALSRTAPQAAYAYQDTQAAWLRLGYVAPAPGTPDFAAVEVAGNILGGGMGSRLFTQLRDKEGLAYAIGTTYSYTAYPRLPYLAVVMGTNPQNLVRAQAGILAEINRLKTQGVPEEELAQTKRYIIGRHIIQHEGMAEQAFSLAWHEYLGLGYEAADRYAEQIDGVTAADVQRVADIYFQNYTLAVVLPD